MSENKTSRVTRFAPTPSGYLHIGNCLSFILTALWAKKNNARILLRIDDLDKARKRAEYVEDIFRVLDLLKLSWEIGPSGPSDFEKNFSQHHRLPLYEEMLDKLIQSSKAFVCNCSRQDLQNRSGKNQYDGHCTQLELKFNPGKSKVRFELTEKLCLLRDFSGRDIHYPLQPSPAYLMLQKNNGLPSYHLGSLVDDLHFGLTHIIRGEDLLSSSIRQMALANSTSALRPFSKCHFLHHKLIRSKNGSKFSKSQQAEGVMNRNYSASEVYRIAAKWMGLNEKCESLGDLEEDSATERPKFFLHQSTALP